MKTQIILYGRQLQNSEGLKVNGSCTRTTRMLTIIIKYFPMKRNIAEVLMIVELNKH